MRVRCTDNRNYAWVTVGKEYEVELDIADTYMIVGDTGKKHAYGKYAFDVVGENEKTFKEVVRDIKEGEVWESCIKGNVKLIEKVDGNIRIKFDNSTVFYSFSEEVKYILTRKKYTFEEAFKYYEEDEENSIESCESGEKYNQLYEGDEYNISMKEIRGLWFIDKLK